MEPPQEEKYKIIYEDKMKEIEVKYEDIKDKILKDFLEEQGIFKEFGIDPEMLEIKNEKDEDILNKKFDGYGIRDEYGNLILNLTLNNRPYNEDEKKDIAGEEKVEELIEEIKEEHEVQESPIKEPELIIEEKKDYDKLGDVPYYILNDRNKFFNWVYPTFEETSYKYIENTEKLKEMVLMKNRDNYLQNNF